MKSWIQNIESSFSFLCGISVMSDSKYKLFILGSILKMGSISRFARGNAFIEAFGEDILKKIGIGVGDKLEIVDEGLTVVDGWEEVHHYVIVRAISQPEIRFTLVSFECIYSPEMTDTEEIPAIVEKYTDLTKDEIELKLQEADLR